MADIAPQPFINYGASQAQQAQGQASANLQNQQAGLVNQQAQQEQMNTEVQRASQPYVMRALKSLYADQSGANAGNPNAGMGRPGGAPATGGPQGVPDDSGNSDASGATPALYESSNMENTLRNQNYVQPVTDREMQMLNLGTALSMSPKTAQMGAAMIARMQTERELRMSTATAQNQLKMGNTYDAASSVATIDPTFKNPGRTFDMLQKLDKADAAAIAKVARNPDGTLNVQMADQLALKYANHLAGVSFLYTGRPHTMENGTLIDTNAGKKVQGQEQVFTGLTTEQRQKEFDRANDQIEWTTPDGKAHKGRRADAPTEYGGYGGQLTPAQSVLAADQAARQHNQQYGNADPASAPPPPGVGDAATGAVAASSDPASRGTPPANGAVGAKVTQANKARQAQQAKQAAAAQQQAQAQANLQGDNNGMLPGVNPQQAPRMVNPTAGEGAGGPSTVGAALQKGVGDRANAKIEATQSTYDDNVKMDSLIKRAQSDVDQLKKTPRMVGPGSSLDQAARNLYAFVRGQPMDATVNETELDKFLNQIGANNVRQLLAGQRITNQEMMTFLTRGSPSTSMPLRAIEGLLNYLKADNEYSMRYNKTLVTSLKGGADPDLTPGYLQQQSNRGDFVTRRLNGAPQLSSGSAPAAEEEVNVIHPDGRKGSIPKSQLKDALSQGYKQAP